MTFWGKLKNLSVVAVAMAIAAMSPATAAETKLSASTDVSKIYIGDSFTLRLSLEGAQSGNAQPVLENIDGASISSAGVRNEFSGSLVVNGVQVGNPVSRTIWSYTVTPRATGIFSVGKATLSANGETYIVKIPDVEVLSPDEQPYVAVTVRPSRESVLVDEKFSITVEILVAKLSGEYSSYNPAFTANGQAPLLEMPFIADVPGNCRFDGDLGIFLEKHTTAGGSDGAFRINNYTVRGRGMGFPSFFGSPFEETTPALFYFSREDAELKGKPAWKYTLELPFISTTEGTCDFAPVRFRGSVFFNENGGEPKAVSVLAVSDVEKVRVTPPPAEGRPDTFIGSLGSYMSAVASIDAQTCNVGDPLVLTLELKGDITLSNIRAPEIFKNNLMAERFRQYGGVGDSIDAGGARFTYRIRPIVSGTIEVPPLKISYYDTQKREYVTISTGPVPLRVNESAEIDPDLVFGAASNSRGVSLRIDGERAPSGITVDVRAVAKPAPGNRAQPFALALVPPATYAVVIGFAALWRRRKSLDRAVRRGSAAVRSMKRLARAKTPQQVMDAVTVLLHDRLDADGASFTPPEVRRELLQHGSDPATADEIGALLQRVFDSRFSPDEDSGEVVKTNRRRLAELFASLKLVLVLMLAFLPALYAAAVDAGAQFTWRHANSMASAARDEGGFHDAALQYRRLLDEGTLSGGLLYNYGTMLMLAGHPDEAVDALHRAEALEGASPETENNLEIALRDARRKKRSIGGAASDGIAISGGSALPWYRVPLFWHYGTPVDLRAEALAIAWCLLWAGLLAAHLGLRRSGRALAFVALFGVAVFGSSVLASRRVLDAPLPGVPPVESAARERGVTE